MRYIAVRDRETRELLFIKSERACNYAEEHDALLPNTIFSCYPSLENDNGMSTIETDELHYVYYRDPGAVEAVKPEKSLPELVADLGGLDKEGKFNKDLFVDGKPSRRYFRESDTLGYYNMYVRCAQEAIDLDEGKVYLARHGDLNGGTASPLVEVQDNVEDWYSQFCVQLSEYVGRDTSDAKVELLEWDAGKAEYERQDAPTEPAEEPTTERSPESYLEDETYFRPTTAVSSEDPNAPYAKECYIRILNSGEITKAYLHDGEEELVNTDDLSGNDGQVGAWWVRQLIDREDRYAPEPEVELVPYDEHHLAEPVADLVEIPDEADTFPSPAQVALEESQKFLKGAQPLKSSENSAESILNASAGGRLGAQKVEALNEGVDPSVIFDELDGDKVAVNFDTHYKQAGEQGLPEPIVLLESVEKRLLEAGVEANRVCNIVRGLKYILRGGFKEGEDVDKEVHKFFNYTHRARTGKWIGE